MKKLIIFFIFILALFLRVYKLGQYPAGFLWDEAALGYNAYSILETGRDEYGKALPIIFKSFGDYKPGLYVYLTVPSIAIFGLNEFAVRLPSALLGWLTVVLVYFLVKEGRFSRMKERLDADLLPVLSAFLLAVSPWHISFSRGAWELNVMVFMIILGLFLLISFISSQKAWQLYLSAIIFIFSLFTYQSAKLIMPSLVIGLIFFFRKELGHIKLKKKISFLVIVLAGFIVFNLVTVVTGKAGRIKVMSLFSYPRSPEESQRLREQDNNNQLTETVFHSSPIFFGRSLAGRYFNHFSGKFLFFTGDWSNSRNSVIYSGVLYLIDVFFLILGLGFLFSKRRDSLENLMIYWLVVAPLPSALTRDSISSVRSFSMVIPLVFIIATGLDGLISFLKKKRELLRNSSYCVLLIAYCLFFVRFLDLYFVHDPIFTSKDRLYGYKEMIEYIKPLIGEKKKVVVTNKYGQPYIFYLFYTKYDPRLYQKIASLKENPFGDVGEVEKVGNIEFKKFYWPNERGEENSLYIGDEFDLPTTDIIEQEKISFLKEIKFLNGKTAFRIVETL